MIPSGGDVTAGAQAFVPVLVLGDGIQHVVVFTSLEGLASVSQPAPYAMTMLGRTFVRGLDPDYGLMVSGRDHRFSIAPQLLAAIRAEG